MAHVRDLKVGQKVTHRGHSGELLEVDQPTGQVRFRYDVIAEPAVSADGVRGPSRPADVTLPAGEVDAVVPATAAMMPARAAIPTKKQIEHARKVAHDSAKAEGLKGDKLAAVEDEAEAELVARMARGEGPLDE